MVEKISSRSELELTTAILEGILPRLHPNESELNEKRHFKEINRTGNR